MFYRRKIILGLLQLFDGQLEKIRLQKLLFLFTRAQSKKDYDFVPYKYGCYSFSASADLKTMVEKGFLSESDKLVGKKDSTDYLKSLKPEDLRQLRIVKTTFGSMDERSLIRHTYLNYPFYATRSEIAEKILSSKELKTLRNENNIKAQSGLYTLGYEGISLEEYLVKLIKNDIQLLIDVRRNPLSMKYGFSKSSIKKFAESLGIAYLHMPELGIASELRQELNDQNDYDKLFDRYRRTNLTTTIAEQLLIIGLLKKFHRVALTCFEADICQCHRKHLAESIVLLSENNVELKHI